MAKWQKRIRTSPARPARIELRCAHIPDTRALELLGMIHDQLAFQEIKMEVVVAEAHG